MNIKNKKLKTAVIASILTFNMGMYNNVFAADVIGQGAYSWDKDWSISLSSNHQGGGGSGSSVSSSIRYRASTGLLYLYRHYYTESDAGQDDWDTEVILGDAKSILDGLSEEEIKDLIHNVDGDQTVDGNQTVTGSQDVQGGQTVSGALLIFKQAVKISAGAQINR